MSQNELLRKSLNKSNVLTAQIVNGVFDLCVVFDKFGNLVWKNDASDSRLEMPGKDLLEFMMECPRALVQNQRNGTFLDGILLSLSMNSAVAICCGNYRDFFVFWNSMRKSMVSLPVLDNIESLNNQGCFDFLNFKS